MKLSRINDLHSDISFTKKSTELNIGALMQVQNLQNFFLQKKYFWSQLI